ncbi:MAG: GAF domain-containing protein [Dehalococcoidia bacterium]|jgi:GAF domain-containing protein|nr:GAF domain-containing protein [Dehalococcoidia bacterium]
MSSNTHPAGNTPVSARTIVLAEISRLVSSEPKIGDVYPGFVDLVGEIIEFDRLSISSVDSMTGTLDALYVDGIFLSDRDAGFGYRLTGTLVGSSIERGRAVGMGGDTLLEHWPGGEELAATGLHSILATPLLVDGVLIGVMLIARKSSAGFSAEEVARAGEVGSQIAGPMAAELRRNSIYRAMAA